MSMCSQKTEEPNRPNRAQKQMSDLYRGTKYGVFTGANGYYVAPMAADGVSHYQPANGGRGWDDYILDECNAHAEELEAEPEED